MSYKTILLQKEDGVATITLNRPEKLNAINPELTFDMTRAIEDVGQDEGVRAVMLTGAGKAFCAGGDIQYVVGQFIPPTDRLELAQKSVKIISAMKELPKPIIAAVNGPAVGGGFSFALGCDITIAAEEASFGTGFIRLGLHPDMGMSYFLPRLVGTDRACELLFTGRMIDAREADRIGLVNQVVPAEQLRHVAREIAIRLAKGPTKAIGLAKSTLYQALTMDMASALEVEARTAALCFTTEDASEGINAFLEKRKPVFKGK